MWRATLVAAICLGLDACASMGGQHELLPSNDIDKSKIESVNQWAEGRGATVIWVNLPSKPHPRPYGG